MKYVITEIRSSITDAPSWRGSCSLATLSRMWRVLRVFVLAAIVCGLAACPGPPKPVKPAQTAEKKQAREKLAEARDSAKHLDYDAADKLYGEAYELAKEFDVL